MKFALGAMTVGDALDRGLKILFARFPQFFVINLVCQGLAILAQAFQPLFIEIMSRGGGGAAALPITLGIGLFVLAVYIVLVQVGTAATLRIVMDEFAGRPSSIGAAFQFAFARFAPLFGTSLLAGLLITLGYLLCIIPGIYLTVCWLFASQVVVLEDLSGMPALERSKRLTEGHRGRVFGTLILLALINFFLITGISFVLNAVWPSVRPVQVPFMGQTITTYQPIPLIHAAHVILMSPVSIVMATYIAIVTTLLYLDMRIRKEAFDLELAATHTAGDGLS